MAIEFGILARNNLCVPVRGFHPWFGDLEIASPPTLIDETAPTSSKGQILDSRQMCFFQMAGFCICYGFKDISLYEIGAIAR